MAKNIVIVGGSLAGLMHGLQHKRMGNNVTILEQDSGERHSHHAGIGFEPNVESFLHKHDLTGITPAFASHQRRFSYYTRPNVLNTNGSINLTSWSLLCSILRANFDGMVSKPCPYPPQPSASDGEGVYLSGKRVTWLEHRDGIITVHYVDTLNGNRQESIDANLVIGADGVNSTVRQLVNAPFRKGYAGYIAWRGTLPENLVSPDTLEFFSDRVSLQFSKRTYFVCYVIPTDNGSFEPGERLLNWVWYYNVPEDSFEITDILTDTSGRLHENTVPRGLVRHDVWDRFRAAILPEISPPFRELLQKTTDPFVTKVRDVECSSASFYDGRVILVGDAFSTLRPHLGLATEQAALHCNALADVYQGIKTKSSWDRDVCQHAKRLILATRIVAELGQGTSFTLLKSLLFYFIFVIRHRFKRSSRL